MRCGFRVRRTADAKPGNCDCLAEQPYALFETFEKDETEEQREEMRREMEARMREKVMKS